jgi:hypothetical protein
MLKLVDMSLKRLIFDWPFSLPFIDKRFYERRIYSQTRATNLLEGQHELSRLLLGLEPH